MDGGRPDDRVHTTAIGQAGVDHRVQAVDVPASRRDHAADRLEQLILVLEPHVRLRQHASPLDEHLVRAVDHDLAHRPVVKEAVEGSIPDRGPEDDVGQGRLLLRGQVDPVLGQESVEVGAHRAREGERVTGGQADVADQRQPVAELVGELAEVATLARGRLENVGPSPLGLHGR